MVHVSTAAVAVIHGGLSREQAEPLAALRALDHRRNVPQRPSGKEEAVLDVMHRDGSLTCAE